MDKLLASAASLALVWLVTRRRSTRRSPLWNGHRSSLNMYFLCATEIIYFWNLYETQDRILLYLTRCVDWGIIYPNKIFELFRPKGGMTFSILERVAITWPIVVAAQFFAYSNTTRLALSNGISFYDFDFMSGTYEPIFRSAFMIIVLKLYDNDIILNYRW